MAFTCLVGNTAHVKAVVGILRDLLEWYITGSYGKIPVSEAQQNILMIAALLVAFPFCGSKTVGALRYVSSMSVSTVLMTCVWIIGECMFWYWPKGHFAGHTSPLVSTHWQDYAVYIPTIAFAYTGTLVLMPVLQEFKQKDSPKAVHDLIGASTLVCLLGYGVFSLIVVMTFGVNVDKDTYDNSTASSVLYLFPPDHYGVTLLKLGLVIVITLLYPIINYPVLHGFETMLRIMGTDPEQWTMSYTVRRLLLTLAGMAFVAFLNIKAADLLQLFGLCGSWGVSLVCYVLPLLFYLKLCPKAPMVWRVLSIVGIASMLVTAVLFTYVTYFT